MRADTKRSDLRITITLGMIVMSLGISGCAHLPFGKASATKNQPESKTIAVAYRNLGTDEVKVYNPMAEFHAASTMKTPVMFQLYRMRDEGNLKMNDQVKVTNEFTSILDGSLFNLPVTPADPDGMYPHLGHYMSIRDLIEKMITWSSNLATNILIDIADPVEIAQTIKAIQAYGVLVLRGVEDLKAYSAGLNNQTTAAGMMNVMTAVYRSNLVADSSRHEMIRILEEQHYNNMIPEGVPDGVQIAHKTGSITRIAHDAAIIFPPKADPYVLVILTGGYTDHSEAQAVGARISKRIYEYHLNPNPNKSIDISDLIPKK